MKIRLLKKKNYLKMIENSAKGENFMFRNLFAQVNEAEVDILENGNLSCAIFCSAILYLQKMINDIHTTVSGVEKDMKVSGWTEIDLPKVGCVVVWNKIKYDDNSEHSHIGFYMGNDRAISNSYKDGMPKEHHYTYNGTRKIEKIYWHDQLND
jgi:hypothetical protein